MPFFSSFTGSFSGGRRRPISIGVGGGAATYSLDGASVSSTFTTSAAPHHFQFNADGTEITGTFGGDLLYTTSLSTPYDPTTGSYSISNPSHQLGIGALGASTIYGFRFNDDGTKAFFTHQTILTPSRGQVTEYSLSTPYDISTLSSTGTTAYDTEGDFAATDLLNINSIAFNADGTKMFLQSGDSIAGLGIFEYDLSSAYTLSTASYSRGFLYTSVLPANLQPFNILFNNAGTKLYVTDFRYDSIYEFDLSTGFDLSTISYNNVSLNFAATDTIPRQMMLSQDETQMYIMGAQNDNIYTLDLVQDAGFGGGGGGAAADFSLLSTPDFTVTPPVPSQSLQYGYSTGISETYALVGSPFQDIGGVGNVGQAYIYDPTDGSLLYTLDNPEGVTSRFGFNVDISDTAAIVGAYFNPGVGSGIAGKAYLFDPTDGSLIATLANPYTNGTSRQFGYSVAASDSYVLVSSYRNGDTGRAHLYDASNGSLLHSFTASDQHYGYDVDVSDTYSIVGSGVFLTFVEDGKAYVYNNSTGSLVYTFTNPNAYGAVGDQFGASVGISASYAIVGAPYEDDAVGSNRGKAYVYDLSDGSLLYTLDNPADNITQALGKTVEINESYAFVGNGNTKILIFDLSDGSLVNTIEDTGTLFDASDTKLIGGKVSVAQDGFTLVGAAYIYNAS